MIPKEKMINIVFNDKGKVKIKGELDTIPTPVVEELINNAIEAYETVMITKIDTDERVSYLKRWNRVLWISLVIMIILYLVR